MAPLIMASIEMLACEMPEKVHPVCQRTLESFLAGDTSVHTPAYVCNMVDSKLIPFVHCLLNAYANGVLLIELAR